MDQTQHENMTPDDTGTSMKGGDGTVPYRSLSWAHSWLTAYQQNGHEMAINVTCIPQHVYFAGEAIESKMLQKMDAIHYDEYKMPQVSGDNYTINKEPQQLLNASTESILSKLFPKASSATPGKYIAFYETDQFNEELNQTFHVGELFPMQHCNYLLEGVVGGEKLMLLMSAVDENLGNGSSGASRNLGT